LPITINKNSSATVLTINNFSNLTIRGQNPADAIADVVGDEEDAILIKVLGPQMTISFEYDVVEEATSVVSGTGSPVTSAVGQFLYLYNTLWSKGTDQITDTYTLTLDFGGGSTLERTGVITEIDCIMASDKPLTFKCTISFQVGAVL